MTKSRKTRSGRVTKKPERWEPQEDVVDDFKLDEYNTDDGSDVSSGVSESDDDEEPNSDDENFIAQDSEEDEEMYEESDEEEATTESEDSDYSE
tara:strand:- start:85 stop:366 length:282 start_codon:yes stop_codon:yes gene_type:complete